MNVSALAARTGDWLSRAMVVGGALTAIDILLPPSRTDQYCNHKWKSPLRFMAGSARQPYAARWRRGRMVAMCYTNEARPPLPPIMGGSTDEGDLVLTAADGNRFRAYAARAATPGGAAVAIIPDPRGVHPFYKDLVRRFAQAGVDAVAVDYLARTAGMSERPATFDLRAAIGKTTPDGIAADVAAGIAYLHPTAGRAAEAVFTVGFRVGRNQA